MYMIFLSFTVSYFRFNGIREKDELVPVEFINELDKRLSAQKGIKVDFQSVSEANHFFQSRKKI